MGKSKGVKLGLAVLVLVGTVGLAVGWAQPRRPGAERMRRRAFPSLIGKITAKTEEGLQIQILRRPRVEGAAPTVNVKVGDQTLILKLVKGTLKDVQPNYLVAVLGERQEGKVTAQGIAVYKKLEGTPQRRDLMALMIVGRVARFVLRLPLPAMGREGRPRAERRAQPGRGRQGPGRRPGGMMGRLPVMGLVTSTEPLQVRTRQGVVSVVTTEQTKVAKTVLLKLEDLKVGDIVSVSAQRPSSPGEAVTALAIAVLPELPRPLPQREGRETPRPR